MKKLFVLLGCLLFCGSLEALELVNSNFSVDSYRFYFSMHFTDLPLTEEGVAVELYPSDQCIVLPVNHERFRFAFDADTGDILEIPEVTTAGAPAQDRWLDGPTDHLSMQLIDFLEWTIDGSIANGAQPYQPGDTLCMLIQVPGSATGWSGLQIQETVGASVYFQKISTTRLATHAGQIIPYSYRIENTSSVFLHDVSLIDDNVDDAPVCAFGGADQLAPEGLTGSVVFCTAEHTVTEEEIETETAVSNTAAVSADELDAVMTSYTIPVTLYASGFESPPNFITLLEDLNEPVGRDSDIAIGADGRPVIAYSDSERNLKLAKCLDVPCTAAVVSIIHGGGNDVGDPSIAIGQDALPVISYHDETDDALLVAKCNDEACRDGDETVSLVDAGGVGKNASIAIGLDDLPVISYRDQSNGKLKVAECNDAACAGGDETVSTLNDPDAATGLNTSLAIGDDGFPVISYMAFMGPFAGTVRVAKCNDAACAGGDEVISTLDTIGSPGFVSTSIALGTDGNPVVAYMDTVEQAIMVVKCNDAACAGNDELLSVVDTSTENMSIALGIAADGNPVISYMGSLGFAHCNDNACAGGNESVAVVDAAAMARTSSVAIGSDDLPVISYFDEVRGALKVVHCGTPDCR